MTTPERIPPSVAVAARTLLRACRHIAIAIAMLASPVPNLAAEAVSRQASLESGSTASPRPPSGPRAVGVTAVHLIDATRPEVATEDPSDARELIVQLWYPAERRGASESAPYFLDAREGAYNAAALGLPPELFEYVSGWAQPQAPPARTRDAFPVVFFSPGLQTPVALYASVLADLASHGYVVVAISHPYSSGVTVFPDGRVAYAPDILQRVDPETLHRIWVDDNQFVLNRLAGPARRGASSVRERLNLDRVATMGHSFGGAAAAGLAKRDRRVVAVVNLDGTFWGGVAEAGLAQSLLLMTGDPRGVDPTHEAFLTNTRGTAYRVAVQDGGHNNFTDFGLLLPLVRTFVPDVDGAQFGLGAIDALRMLDIAADYVLDFLDHVVRRRWSSLLEGASPAYPEVVFQKTTRR